MIKIRIPVYYTKHFVRKASQTFLLSLNWYRNAHHMEQNKVKQDLEEYIQNQLATVKLIKSPFTVSYYYYYKNKASDLPNVGPLASKWLLDTLQKLKIISQDNVQHLVEEHYYAVPCIDNDPRIEAIIEEKETDEKRNTIIKRRTKQSV